MPNLSQPRQGLWLCIPKQLPARTSRIQGDGYDAGFFDRERYTHQLGTPDPEMRLMTHYNQGIDLRGKALPVMAKLTEVACGYGVGIARHGHPQSLRKMCRRFPGPQQRATPQGNLITDAER
jgi:hypothetical protein